MISRSPRSKSPRPPFRLLWRAALFLALVTLLTLWPPGLDRPLAESPPPAAPADVAAAAGHLSPVPAYRLFPPRMLRRFAERARARIWELPSRRTWPRDDDGRPIVETERVERLRHTVAAGETLGRIRARYRTTHARLRELNPDRDLSELETGDELVVWKRDGEVPVSYGAPDWGRVYHAEPLPPDDAYVILYLHRTFGTHYTVSETRRVLTSYVARFPDAHKLMVGDIGFRTGGQIHPHHSHRSGRDIDISYPRKHPPPTLQRFHEVHPYQLDVDKTLFLLKEFLDGGYVEHVFMDRQLQRLLYREAEQRGAPDEWLERVFEYPDWGNEAIVQHSSGHRNHLHIRFHCQPTDRRCR